MESLETTDDLLHLRRVLALDRDEEDAMDLLRACLTASVNSKATVTARVAVCVCVCACLPVWRRVPPVGIRLDIVCLNLILHSPFCYRPTTPRFFSLSLSLCSHRLQSLNFVIHNLANRS